MGKLNIKKQMNKSAKLIRRKIAIDEQIAKVIDEIDKQNDTLKNKSNKYEEQEEE